MLRPLCILKLHLQCCHLFVVECGRADELLFLDRQCLLLRKPQPVFCLRRLLLNLAQISEETVLLLNGFDLEVSQLLVRCCQLPLQPIHLYLTAVFEATSLVDSLPKLLLERL